MDFLSNRFGNSIAQQLLDIHLQRKQVSNFEELPLGEQFSFISYMFNSIFGEFYDAGKISRINIACFLRFALEQAAQRMEQMFQITTTVGDMALESVSNSTEVQRALGSPGTMMVGFRFLDGIDGYLVVIHQKDAGLDLARKLMSKMSPGHSNDAMALEVLSEFYNIIIPPFLGVVGDTMDVDIKYIPEPAENVRATLPTLQTEALISASFSIRLNKKDYPLKAYFVLQKSGDALKALIAENLNAMDPLEKAPPQLVARVTGAREADIIGFFERDLRFRYGQITLQRALDALEIHSVGSVSYGEADRLTDYIIKLYFYNASTNKKQNIRINMRYALGIGGDADAA